MKKLNQRGVGFLPVLIVILLLTMTAVSYHVYRQHEANKDQDSTAAESTTTDQTGAQLTDIQQSLAAGFDTFISGQFSSERVDASMVFKDEASGLLVNIGAIDGATRFILPKELSEATAQEITQYTNKTLTSAGFSLYAGTLAVESAEVQPYGNIAYQRGNEYCYVTALNSASFDTGCLEVTTSEIISKANELKPYYEASERYFEENFPNEENNFLEVIELREETRKTINGVYEVVTGSSGGIVDRNGFYEGMGGGRTHFYRTITGQWNVGPGSGNGMSGCEDYTTDAERTIYAEDTCINPSTDESTTVAEYWQ